MNSKLLRRVFSKFATGITVVTTINHQGVACGVTINSFNSLSLEPPMILFCLKKESPLLELIGNHGFFGVNVLNSEQTNLSDRFALTEKSTEMDDISFINSEKNLPIFSDSLAAFECSLSALHEGGDHRIILGEVENIHLGQGDPLLYYRSHYARLEPLE
jgi:flavin reductase (DIM6/NTAB) family NADH-FMN oxidoreductase RutF